MAIKYRLPDGSETDMVINSLKFFLVATGEEFRDLFLAIAASPPGAPKPTKLDEFAAAHPSVGAASATVATPDSYADEAYYGVDAFIFVNNPASGRRCAIRRCRTAWCTFRPPMPRSAHRTSCRPNSPRG